MQEEFNPDLNQDAKINRDQLHIECSELPDKYKQYTLMLSTAIKDRDNAKDYFVRSRAKAEISYREKSPEELGIKKVTEASIKAAIDGDPNLADQVKIIRDLEEDVRNIAAMVDALEMKGEMLSNLVTLWQTQYPDWNHTGYDQTQDDIRKNLREKKGK